MVSALAALFIGPAVAQNGPRILGEYGQWTAAVQRDGRQKVCFAFSSPTRMSHPRSDAYLIVSHSGTERNAVELAADYRYPSAARVTVSVGRTALRFEADGNSAYAVNGGAAVAAFRRGDQAIARGPRRAGQRGVVTDTFSLRGFTAAYNAMSRECAARRRG